MILLIVLVYLIIVDDFDNFSVKDIFQNCSLLLDIYYKVLIVFKFRIVFVKNISRMEY